ncbi:MAG: excinuclease ABC subunit UvrC [Verrucomicrobiales bacterium]|nr:excinuclease ABC subunit UvrC [Verrucomicrobiales bacterium]
MIWRDMATPEKTDFQKKLHDVPHEPGVYLMRDRFKKVIYVGKARDLRKRLASYFTPSRKKRAELKTKALIDSIWSFDIHTVRSEPEALLLESKLIKDYRPKYNVSFRDDKRFLMAKVNLEEPLPRFQLARVRKGDGAKYFGPFVHSAALRETLNWLSLEFGLRTCSPLQPGESDYKHCHDDVIRNCSAPCVGKVSGEEYRAKVEEACAFMKGRSREMVGEIETEMLRAAEDQDFERAAQLRDMAESMKKTLLRARNFLGVSGLPEGSTIQPKQDVLELQQALGMAQAPTVMECFDISNISNTYSVASMVQFREGRAKNQNYRRFRIKTVTGQDDFASMAEVVKRRYTGILRAARDAVGEEVAMQSQLQPLEAMREWQEKLPVSARLPDLVIVDGGKGQLSSAMKELQLLGLHDLPIIGLAKEREEIFQPGCSQPIVLSHETGALKLLQRIRDEAHRFANGYHQILMKRRIKESVLDDCPGISRIRKERLLKSFGSLARLRKAEIEKIAEVPGISLKLAGEILQFLKTHGS